MKLKKGPKKEKIPPTSGFELQVTWCQGHAQFSTRSRMMTLISKTSRHFFPTLRQKQNSPCTYLSDKLMTCYKDQGQELIFMHHTMMEASVPLSEAVCMSESWKRRPACTSKCINCDAISKNPKLMQPWMCSLWIHLYILLTSHYTGPQSLQKKGERIFIYDNFV